MAGKNKTKYKTLDKLAKDPRITEIWSEEDTGDGIWVSLAPGWNFDGCSCVHNWSVKGVLEDFSFISEGNPY